MFAEERKFGEGQLAYACGAVMGLFLTVKSVSFYNAASRRVNSSPDFQVRSTL
jgi:hypothetical protein